MNNKIFNKNFINIKNEKKIFFPKDSNFRNITKEELINYYIEISQHILPYLKDRLLTMQRFPDGILGNSFYNKNIPKYFPDWIETKHIKNKTKNNFSNYIICQNIETLVYITNQGCITPHIWLSKKDKLNIPDKIIFDLDPENNNFDLVIKAAKSLKIILDDLNLNSFVMTTGSRGMHITIPIKREHKFDTVREFAKKIATKVTTEDNNLFTLEPRKNKRGNKLFLDIMRNSYGATAVTPYAVRAKPGAPIATPLDWKELDDSNLYSQKYNIDNIFLRLNNNVNNNWELFESSAKSISKLIKKKLK